MAIFGNLEEMPAAEVLSAVRRSTGTLLVCSREQDSIEVHLNIGLIVGFERGGQPISDPFELGKAMLTLLCQQQGDFEFRRRSVEHMGAAACLNAPLMQLVVNGLGSNRPGVALPPRDALPSPKTVFEFVSEPRIWLDDELQRFYEIVGQRLRGERMTIEELAAATAVSLEEACLQIYRLRLAGVVSATRARESVHRLAKGAGADLQLQGAMSASGEDVDLRRVRTVRPARALLARLLGSLASLLRP